MSQQSIHWMQRAITIAKRGTVFTRPNPKVGCVIVTRNNQIIEGYHACYGGPHAEASAIDCAYQRSIDLTGATAYVTLEPCCHYGKTPPCADALIDAGIETVYVAMEDPNPLVSGQGIRKLEQAGVKVHVGLCYEQAVALNVGFVFRHSNDRPLVRVKVAASIDGKVAMANGQSQWITGEQARADVHQLRADSDAIMTGIGTVLADNPSMNVRIDGLQAGFSQPYRVVVDRSLQLSPSAKIIGQDHRCLVFTESQNFDKQKQLQEQGVTVIQMTPGQTDDQMLSSIFKTLLDYQVNDLMVEAGPALTSTFLKTHLCDALIVYTGARLLGCTAKSMTNIQLVSMAESFDFQLQSVEALGDDIKSVYRSIDLP